MPKRNSEVCPTFFTCVWFFTIYVLFKVSITLYTHRAHTHGICHESTNYPFLCILSGRQLQTLQAVWSSSLASLMLLFCISFVSQSFVSNKVFLDTFLFFFAFPATPSSCSCLRATGVVRKTSPVFARTHFLCFFVFAKADLGSSDCGGAIASIIALWKAFSGHFWSLFVSFTKKLYVYVLLNR